MTPSQSAAILPRCNPVFGLSVYPQAQRYLPGFWIDDPFRNATGRIFSGLVTVVAFPISLAGADYVYHQSRRRPIAGDDNAGCSRDSGF